MRTRIIHGINIYIDDEAKSLTLQYPPRVIVEPKKLDHQDHTAKSVVMPFLWGARDQKEYFGIREDDYLHFGDNFSTEEYGPIMAFARLHLARHGSLDKVAQEGLLRSKRFNNETIYFPTRELASMGVRKY